MNRVSELHDDAAEDCGDDAQSAEADEDVLLAHALSEHAGATLWKRLVIEKSLSLDHLVRRELTAVAERLLLIPAGVERGRPRGVEAVASAAAHRVHKVFLLGHLKLGQRYGTRVGADCVRL